MKRKNILMILPEFGYGGAEKAFCALSVELSKFHNIRLVVFNLLQAPMYPIGGEVISLKVLASNNWIVKLTSFYKRVVRLRKIKRLFKPQVSISFLEGADYINLLSSQKDKTIISIHGSKIHDQSIRGMLGFVRKNIIIPLLYNRADIIFTVSKKLKQELVYLGVTSPAISYISNVYNVDNLIKKSIEEFSDEFKELTNLRYLVNVGRLHPQKNHKGLISVYLALKKLDTNLKLVIVGEGEEYDSLLSNCSIRGLKSYPLNGDIKSSDVIFTGLQSNPHVFVKNSLSLILSSDWEGLPTVLIEAMIIGKSVISSDCHTGPRELIAPDNLNIHLESEAERTEIGLLLPVLGNHPENLKVNLWAIEINKYLQEIALTKAKLLCNVAKEHEIDFVMKKWNDILNAI